jgi:heme-degrading monooxygenase HmoA
MIVRTWHGSVPRANGDAFARHLERTGVMHARSLAGNRGAFVERRVQDELEHFFLATCWESLEAVKAFAGEDFRLAARYPEDEQFGLVSDPLVFHHEVAEVRPIAPA